MYHRCVVSDATDPDFLSVRETARRLGVHENTIRNWARDGVIVSSRVSGTSAHRFAATEVERLVASRGQAASAVAPTRRVARPELATAADLDQWAASEAAKGEFPELMRRLLAATPGITNLDIRTHEGTAAAGWDGRASSRGSTFLSAGILRMEFGTNTNPKSKAQEDYSKRSTESDAAKYVFVFATPRNWPGASAWADERRGEGRFADVVALDAHRLEALLQAAPSVHYWISERLGLRPHGVQTLDQWWDGFSRRMEVVVPESFFVAGRSREVEALVSALTSTGSPAEPLVVKAPTDMEAIAFIMGALADNELRSRVLVVTEGEVWPRLTTEHERLILIPTFPSPDLGAARAGGHLAILPADAGVAVRDSAIELRKIDRVEAAAALREANVDRSTGESSLDADALVALARRSLPAFVRALAIDSRIETPKWASDTNQVGILAPLLLAGRWGNGDGDHRALELLTSHPWPQIERLLKSLMSSGDAPFVLSGGTWRLAAPTESALLLAPHLTDSDLQRWGEVTKNVLLEPDPFAGMDETERFTASATGVRAEYSELLRDGLTDSLALLGSLSDQVPAPPIGAYADGIVRDLLEAANADGTGAIWARLAGGLPDLAEASPDQFLDALDVAMSGTTPLIATMFRDSREDGVFGPSSPHPSLQWALERLCYSSDFFGRAATVMGDLARIDPGGRLSNRPLESLGALLAPWLAYTAGSLDDKFAVVERALQRDPVNGWKVALTVLPDSHAFLLAPNSPTYRDWNQRERSVSVRDWLQFIHKLVPLVLNAAAADPSRWITLIPRIYEFPPAEREISWARLGDIIASSGWSDEERFRMWEALVGEADRHAEFPDAEWSLPPKDVATIRDLASRLEPASDPRRFAALFDWHVAVPGMEYGDDGYLEEVDRLQREALAVVVSGGVESVKALAREVKAPHVIGRYLAEFSGFDDEAVLSWLTSKDQNLSQAATTFAARRAEAGGAAWVAQQLAGHESDVGFRRALVAALPWRPEYWTLVAALAQDVEKDYWHRRLHPASLSEDLHDEVLEQLLAHDEVWSALEFAHDRLYAKNPPRAAAVKEILLRLRGHSEPPASRMDADRALRFALGMLEEQTPDDPDLPGLEFTFFPLLHDHGPAHALFRLLNSNSNEFVELVKMVVRAEGETVRNSTSQQQAAARVAFDVLRHWSGIPGLSDDGSIDGDQLADWVRQARSELAASGRESVGDEMVGEVLSHSPLGSDGAWPAEAVRDVIEMAGNVRLETGLIIGKSNQRGVTSRGVFDGGDQERALAANFQTMATTVRSRWPRTARVLNRLAESYERDARWHDADAERLADDR